MEMPAGAALALVRHLPEDAALTTEGEGWTATHELLASALEVAHAQWLTLQRLGGAKPSRLPKAIRVPRPGDARRQRDTKHQEFAAFAEWAGGTVTPVEG